MKYVMVNPSNLKGKVSIPSSKSVCHRAVICAGLSEGISNIDNVVFSQDIEATCEAMKSLGVNIEKQVNSIKIKGTQELKVINNNIDCNESGSTLRFLIPVAATTGKGVIFEGKGKLEERRLGPYYKIFDIQKINYKKPV